MQGGRAWPEGSGPSFIRGATSPFATPPVRGRRPGPDTDHESGCRIGVCSGSGLRLGIAFGRTAVDDVLARSRGEARPLRPRLHAGAPPWSREAPTKRQAEGPRPRSTASRRATVPSRGTSEERGASLSGYAIHQLGRVEDIAPRTALNAPAPGADDPDRVTNVRLGKASPCRASRASRVPGGARARLSARARHAGARAPGRSGRCRNAAGRRAPPRCPGRAWRGTPGSASRRGGRSRPCRAARPGRIARR